MVLQNSQTTELPSVLADLRAIVLIYHQSVITMSSPLTLTKEIFVPLTRLFRGPLVYFRLTRLIYGAINLSSVIRRKVGSQDFHGLVSNEFNIRRERERGRVRFSYNIGTCIYIALYVRGEGDDQRADKSRDVPGYKSLLSWGKRKNRDRTRRADVSEANLHPVLILLRYRYIISYVWPSGSKIYLISLTYSKTESEPKIQFSMSIIFIIEKWKWKMFLLLRRIWNF